MESDPKRSIITSVEYRADKKFGQSEITKGHDELDDKLIQTSDGNNSNYASSLSPGSPF